MTFFIECGGDWNWCAGIYRSRTMLRFWWGPIALGIMGGDMADFHARAATGETEWTEN